MGSKKKGTTLRQYKVVLYNDNSHNIGLVISVILDTFLYKKEEAVALAFRAHRAGEVICAVEHLEAAEYHCKRLNMFGLNASVVGNRKE